MKSLEEVMYQIAKEAQPGIEYTEGRTVRSFALIRDTAFSIVGADIFATHRENYFDYHDYYEEYDEEQFDYSECDVPPFKTREEHYKHHCEAYKVVYARDLGEKILDGLDTYLQWEIDENGYDIEKDECGYLL